MNGSTYGGISHFQKISKGGHQSHLGTCGTPFGIGWHLQKFQKWLCSFVGAAKEIILGQEPEPRDMFSSFLCQFKTGLTWQRRAAEMLRNFKLSPLSMVLDPSHCPVAFDPKTVRVMVLNPERDRIFHVFQYYYSILIMIWIFDFAVGAMIALNPTGPQGVQLFTGHLECCCNHLWVGHWSGAFQGSVGWVVFKVSAPCPSKGCDLVTGNVSDSPSIQRKDGNLEVMTRLLTRDLQHICNIAICIWYILSECNKFASFWDLSGHDLTICPRGGLDLWDRVGVPRATITTRCFWKWWKSVGPFRGLARILRPKSSTTAPNIPVTNSVCWEVGWKLMWEDDCFAAFLYSALAHLGSYCCCSDLESCSCGWSIWKIRASGMWFFPDFLQTKAGLCVDGTLFAEAFWCQWRLSECQRQGELTGARERVT